MRRRFLSLTLCFVLLLALAMPARADFEVQQGYRQPDPSDLLEVTLQIHSNRTVAKELDGLYYDNVFYIGYEAVCNLTDCLIYPEDLGYNQISFSMYGGRRKITVTDDCRLTETYGGDKFGMDIPTATWGGELYVSAPHILRYMGADVDFAVNANAAVHMSVSMPYTVLELYRDYMDSKGYRFSWSEAEGSLIDPEDIQTLAAIDTIFFGYDSHLVIQGLFPSYSEAVMEELYRDVVMQTVLTNVDGVLNTEDPCLTLLGDVSGQLLASDAWIQSIVEVADFEGADKLIADILKEAATVEVIDVSGAASSFIKVTGGVADALQTVIQYNAVNSGQRDALASFLKQVPKSSYMYELQPDLFDAAQLARDMIDDQQLVIERESKKILFDLAVDSVTGMIPIVSTIASATEIISTVIQSIPDFGAILSAEANITTASVASTLGYVSHNLVAPQFTKVTISTPKGTGQQEYLRADMLMSLKASLLTRLQLMESGMLSDAAEGAMATRIQWNATLLNKAENAQYVQVEMPVVREDLTWIEKLAGKGRIGYAVVSGKHLYYWQHHADAFSSEAYFGNFSYLSPATLVRRDEDGTEEALFDATANKFVVTSTSIFYTSDGLICSRNTDGTNYREWVPGKIVDVDPHGNYLIYNQDDVYYSLDTWNGTVALLFEDGFFEGCHGGVVYYSVEIAYDDPDYQNALDGKVTLRAVDVDGSNDRLMVTTATGLYGGARPGSSPAFVQKLHFGENGLYFSYGSIGGTGQFFQGGKIVFVSYDGSESYVVAGEGSLVDANFGIREDGSIATSTDQDFLFYDGDDDFYTQKGTLYWMDPVTGWSRALIDTESLSSSLDSERFYINRVSTWEDQSIILVHHANRDASQDIGWREYTIRTVSIVYLLDHESGTLTTLYTF